LDFDKWSIVISPTMLSDLIPAWIYQRKRY